MKVRDVEAFHISGEANVFVRDKYKENVELPGLAACLYLYDLNIQTTWFNCNKENPNVDLHFSFETLSIENKEIARSLEKDGLLFIDKDNYGNAYCYIRFDASLDDDVEMISNRLLEIVKPFTYQDVMYGYETLDRFIDNMFFRFELDYPTDEELRETIKECRCYYDEENELIWENEELYQKHQEYLESIKRREVK